MIYPIQNKGKTRNQSHPKPRWPIGLCSISTLFLFPEIHIFFRKCAEWKSGINSKHRFCKKRFLMLGSKKQKLPLAEDIPPQEQTLRGRFPLPCRSQTRGTSTFLSLLDIFLVKRLFCGSQRQLQQTISFNPKPTLPASITPRWVVDFSLLKPHPHLPSCSLTECPAPPRPLCHPAHVNNPQRKNYETISISNILFWQRVRDRETLK